ncbi:lysine exporter LysO family protein [Phascolarctobacterium faecium]|nr:lysine exporter LysO family protein [Phascolarctobacterium faecium]MDM8110524.1 lysine exporter LysO family protein [Phascolarctobacterium faecium]
MLSVAVSLVGGLLFGYLFLDTGVKDTLDLILMSALDVMIFIAGIEIGSNRGILKRICNLHSALLALAIPLAVACGSICGALLLGHIAGLSAYDSLLVGGGLGWYSFSSVVISAMYSTEIGTVAFLANMMREISGFFLIPLLVRVHKFLALAPSGAATMDSGLPVVIKYTNLHVGMYSFINGLVLTLIVPVLISWLLSLK